jgi:hypothetical protein
MANDVPTVGSFIPNKAGNPKLLTLDPAERALFLAAKEEAKQKADQQDQAQTVAPTDTGTDTGGVDINV